MHEAIPGVRQNGADQQHTVEVDKLGDDLEPSFQASCVCGWSSREFRRFQDANRAGRRHTRDTTPPRLPFWQPEPCPSWCVVEHHDADLRDERRHESAWAAFERPRLEAVPDGRGGWRPRRAGVRITQRIRPVGEGPSPTPVVRLCAEIDSGEWSGDEHPVVPTVCTPFEALELAELLRRMAVLAYGDDGSAAPGQPTS